MKLEVISADFIFSLLINNMSSIAVSESEKITCNMWHVDIYYHHIWDLIQNDTIEVLHIFSRKITADDLIKTLRVIKFKKFRSLTELSKESLDIKDEDSSLNDDFDSESKWDSSNSDFWWFKLWILIIRTNQAQFTQKCNKNQISIYFLFRERLAQKLKELLNKTLE